MAAGKEALSALAHLFEREVKRLPKAGVDPESFAPRRANANPNQEAILNDLTNGIGVNAVARKYGLSAPSVSRYKESLGIDKVGTGGRPVVAKEQAPSGENGAWEWAKPGAPKTAKAFYDPRLSPTQNKAVEMGRNGYLPAEIIDELDIAPENLKTIMYQARKRGAVMPTIPLVGDQRAISPNSRVANAVTLPDLVKSFERTGDLHQSASSLGMTYNNANQRIWQYNRINNALRAAAEHGTPSEQIASEVAKTLDVSENSVRAINRANGLLKKATYFGIGTGALGAGYAASNAQNEADASPADWLRRGLMGANDRGLLSRAKGAFDPLVEPRREISPGYRPSASQNQDRYLRDFTNAGEIPITPKHPGWGSVRDNAPPFPNEIQPLNDGPQIDYGETLFSHPQTDDQKYGYLQFHDPRTSFPLAPDEEAYLKRKAEERATTAGGKAAARWNVNDPIVKSLIGAGVAGGALAAGANQDQADAMNIGPLAKTWDKVAHTAALGLEKSGASAQDIFRQTGTFRGVDGKWRQQISDEDASFTGAHAGPLSSVLQHNKLYEAYPGLANIKAQASDKLWHGEASYRPIPGFEKVRFSTSESPYGDATKPALLHEAQHAIHRRERFSPGGNARSADLSAFLAGKGRVNDSYERLMGETEARQTEARANLTDDQQRENYPLNVKRPMMRGDAGYEANKYGMDYFPEDQIDGRAVSYLSKALYGTSGASAVVSALAATYPDRHGGAPSFALRNDQSAARAGGGAVRDETAAGSFDDMGGDQYGQIGAALRAAVKAASADPLGTAKNVASFAYESAKAKPFSTFMDIGSAIGPGAELTDPLYAAQAAGAAISPITSDPGTQRWWDDALRYSGEARQKAIEPPTPALQTLLAHLFGEDASQVGRRLKAKDDVRSK